MSKERGLLNLCAVTFKARNICPLLLKEISELLNEPEQDNTQYLLDQVARLTAENAMLKEKWSEPKRTSLELEIADCCGSEDYREGFRDGALYAEKHTALE